jgi:hypothetical protein
MRPLWNVLLGLLCFALPTSAWAGRVFGDIKLGDKPLPAGGPVKIARVTTEDGKSRTASVPADSTATDEFGSYKLMVKEPGKCVLAIVYEKQTASLEVFSYKEATRYDLILERKDGKLALRRK